VHHEAEAIIKSILHLANQVEVRHGSGHGPRILSRPLAALVPPHQGSQLTAPPITQALQLHRGDTMYQGYSNVGRTLHPGISAIKMRTGKPGRLA
jgi:hypothetical protein